MAEAKKRALIVTALAGFVRSFLTHDIELLKDMGYEVHCAANIHHPGAEGMGDYFNDLGVVFHQIDFSSNRPLSRNTLESYSQLKRLRNNVKFAVVHCHTPIAGAIARWVFRNDRKDGCKVIYTTHGFYFHKRSSKKAWIIFYPIEKLMAKYCDAIITINNEDFEVAKKIKMKAAFHINGVGVNLQKYRNVKIDREDYRQKLGIASDDIVVLSVGELSSRKNQKVVVEAIGLINNPKLLFVHCGNAMNSANTKQELLDIAKQFNVRIKLLGLRSDMPSIYQCADIGTLSSTREGLGLAGIEMLAAGLPIVASNVHGILDYMQDGKNGYLADPYSPQEFASGIRKMLDPAIRNAMRQFCSESVDRFDCSVSFRQMQDIYQKVLSG